MKPTRTPTPLPDVLYAFSLDERDLNADLLDSFIRIYPEHAEALTDFAIELAVDSLRANEAVECTEAKASPSRRSPAVSRAMSRFQNRLHAVKQLASVPTSQPSHDVTRATNPFESLDRRALRTLAEDLKANTVFVLKLRDRQIEPNTIPEGFIRRLADLLATKFDAVVAHLNAPMQSQYRLQFLKADRKPDAVSRQNFEDAVRSSRLTDEQQRHLLSF